MLIFVFFMISDPQTSPRSQQGRILYAVATAAVAAAALISVQTTEFGIKVAILSLLVVTCPLVSVFEKAATRMQDRRAGHPVGPWLAEPPRAGLGRALRNRVVVAVALIAVAAPLDTALLARDDKVVLIERGLTGRPVQ